jgi:hypothetical protein
VFKNVLFHNAISPMLVCCRDILGPFSVSDLPAGPLRRETASSEAEERRTKATAGLVDPAVSSHRA